MKTILIPTDFSESSFGAANYAASLARQLHVSMLILYHSNTMPSQAAELPMLHEHTREMLDSFKQRLQPFLQEGTPMEILTDEFPLTVAIERITKKYGVDLVVMSTTGKGNMERAVVGSNTVNVAKECSAPLLLIPPKTKFVEIKKLLFATDLKDVNNVTPIEYIRKFVGFFKCQLVVLNISNSEDTDSDPDIVSERSALELLFEKEQPEYHYIKGNAIVNGILEFAISHQIQVISIVPKRQGFFESMFHRNLTTDFAYHTYLPLLLLKCG